MKRIALLLLLLSGPAFAQNTTAQLQTEVSNVLPDRKPIKASDLRTMFLDTIVSSVNKTGDTMTGSLKAPGIYSSVGSLNVRDPAYGAVADSTGIGTGTNNAAAFNAAVAAAISSCRTLVIPAGKYRLSSAIGVDLSALTTDEQCRPSIVGEGSGSVDLYFDAGNYNPISVTGSTSNVNMFLSIRGIRIVKADQLGGCLTIGNAAYIGLDDVATVGCTYGVLGVNVLSSSFSRLRVTLNTYGMFLESSAGSHPNAITCVACVFGNSLENAIYLQNPTTFKMVGGSVEGNGFQGATFGGTATKGGIFVDGAPIEGGAGVSIDGVYFEQNAGTDITINTSGGSATGNAGTYSVRDSTFNRINNTYYAVNHIKVTGSVVSTLRTGGNAYKDIGTYTASSANQHVDLSGSTNVAHIDLGNQYDNAATERLASPDFSVNTSGGVQRCGKLTGANLNSTADQAIPISMKGNYTVQFIRAVNPSAAVTTAVGGVYSAVSKAGVPIVAASQAWSGLSSASINTVGNTLAPTVATTANLNVTNLYLSLTTAEGSTRTADLIVYCMPTN